MSAVRLVRGVSVATVIAAAVAGCGRGGAEPVSEGDNPPARVTAVDDAGLLHRVQLTADAARRIDLQTARVQTGLHRVGSDGAHPLQIPAAALIYDQNGHTWVYVAGAQLTFQRAQVAVSRIEGDTAVLSSGPVAGTTVATVGVAELRGAEEGVPGE